MCLFGGLLPACQLEVSHPVVSSHRQTDQEKPDNDEFEQVFVLEAVRNNSTNDNIVLTLVGNKSDLCGRHTGSRRVKRQEGERFADAHGLMHVETSAKTGENVTEAFLMTALTVLEKVRTGQVNVHDSASGVRLNANGGSGGQHGSGSGRRANRGENLEDMHLDNRKRDGGCC